MTGFPQRLFWIAIFLYLAVRLGLGALSYRGDTRPEARERALQYFSAGEIELGDRYHRAGFGAAVAWLLLSTAALVFVITSGASAWLAGRCLAWAGGRAWLQVLIFMTIALTAAWALALPYAWYAGQVVERRFGFSNLTGAQWMAFQVKSGLVGLATALVAGSLAYALVRRFPRAWVWIAPGGALAFQLAFVLLYPRLILPLFYEIRPIEDGPVKAAIERVAGRAGVAARNIRVIGASRYSQHTNAFFIGFGRFKDIYLYDTLLEGRTPEEVASVLAHEAGHWTRGHVAKGVALGTAGIAFACALLYFGYPSLEHASYLKIGPLADISSLPMLALLASIGSFAVAPAVGAVSRRFEREADAAGLRLSASRAIVVSDFRKLAVENHNHLTPHPWAVWWRHSHPPVVERMEAAERDAIEDASPGETRPPR